MAVFIKNACNTKLRDVNFVTHFNGLHNSVIVFVSIYRIFSDTNTFQTLCYDRYMHNMCLTWVLCYIETFSVNVEHRERKLENFSPKEIDRIIPFLVRLSLGR